MFKLLAITIGARTLDPHAEENHYNSFIHSVKRAVFQRRHVHKPKHRTPKFLRIHVQVIHNLLLDSKTNLACYKQP